MPWRETSPMDQKTQFIADYLRESLSITELCELYGISRNSGYKWIDRYLRHGPAGLEVCDVEAQILLGALEERGDPQRFDPQILKVAQFLSDPSKVTDAITIRVFEGPRIDGRRWCGATMADRTSPVRHAYRWERGYYPPGTRTMLSKDQSSSR